MQRCWVCIIIGWFFISRGIWAFGCKMVIFSTSIIPYAVTISTHPGVRSGPRLFHSLLDGSIIMSISTPISGIVIIVTLISIPTLTYVSIGHFVCNWVSYYCIYCNSDNDSYHSYHLTCGYSIYFLIYFYNLVCNCFYCYNSLYYHLGFFLY